MQHLQRIGTLLARPLVRPQSSSARLMSSMMIKSQSRTPLGSISGAITVPPPSNHRNLPLELPKRLPLLINNILVPTLRPKVLEEEPSRMPTKEISDDTTIRRQKRPEEILCIIRPKQKRVETHLMIIRRRKMKKHQLKKWRKKYLALIKKTRLRREIAKEKLFRAELLDQIRQAEEFDAERHVRNILATIKSVPKPKSYLDKYEDVKEKLRQHKFQTTSVIPKFEDL